MYVLIGDTPLAGTACAQLSRDGMTIVHLGAVSDSELAAALTDDVDGVVVLLHDDTAAIRYVLTVEHLRQGVPIFVAVFDRTAAQQLRSVVPRATVQSPADVALPSLLGAVLGANVVAVGPDLHAADTMHWRTPGGATRRRSAVVPVKEGPSPAQQPELERAYRTTDYEVPQALRRAGWLGVLRGQFRPHDGNSAILLTGLIGLACILIVDTLLQVLAMHADPLDALLEAVAVLSTVGPAPEVHDLVWYEVFTIVAMLAAIIFVAVFTAGVVEHLLSGRFVGIFGRRAVPRSGQVIVVGLGQVGLRLCQELRGQGLAVVAVERDAGSPRLPAARAANIPVFIGDGGSRRTLARLSVRRSLAVVAVGSDELDNIAVAITARALNAGVPVVMRAGDHDAIDETASLFRIGSVVDVNGLTVGAVRDWTRGENALYFADAPEGILRVAGDGEVSVLPKVASRVCPHVETLQ